MKTVEEARRRILEHLTPVSTEWISLERAYGRVLAEPVDARHTRPARSLSAMDGYAVRSADAAPGRTLHVIGEAPAGHPFEEPVGAGDAVRIFTGAGLPPGADAVAIQEDVERHGDTIQLREPVSAGTAVRPRGLDFVSGETLIEAPRRLAPRHVGIAAAAGLSWLRVFRRPRVALLATGDELRRPGDPIDDQQVITSSSYALRAYVEAWGGTLVDLGIARDDRESLKAAARAADGVDLVLTTGGASVGDYDLVRSALGEDGLDLNFWKVAMRPGKPLIYGSLRGTPFLGLPGNPVSSLVCAWLFLRPMLELRSGLEATLPPTVKATLVVPVPKNGSREDYLRSTLTWVDDRWMATPFDVQDSSMLSTYARADGLVVRPADGEALDEGASVTAIRFEGSTKSSSVK
ncbi:MAG: gephyrin-like molybdotransferase Glp [Myxococcota bacterium]